MTPLSATYRLQPRQGVDFDRARALLPYIADLGARQLYLSPIFTAESDSTHGYDVADPSEIDPVLQAAVRAEDVAKKAREAGGRSREPFYFEFAMLKLLLPALRDCLIFQSLLIFSPLHFSTPDIVYPRLANKESSK